MSVLLKSDKIDKLKECLEDLNMKNGNKGCILCSEEGLVVISTKDGENEIEFDSLAAMGATILSIMNDQIFLDIIVTYENKKVFIRKIEGDICNFIFINIFEYNKRYFRRDVNKTIKKISGLLTFN
ncbi:MAG: roadblock/LC7 domain-containing protein [Candidatus Hodarchaeota archaeon]